ncbi:hypothetical protein BAOM_3108 [Peribacillus asahii]|uniref:Uncharacterized protein n=1 Tax=Peribacillus asahii TaxID=228899 RepID=A0A3T0KTH2_9BACI|nr:hypothetical protein [Peribacillus asahii]AZV43717.1 hypothetical protein BAOM_3108 [Peribacillus asahii]
MDKKIDKFVPVLFQKLNTYENESEDTRFLKVKIWLMHTEENLNGSYFDKKVVEEAIPTLANTPILAYIEENSEDEVDFSDHRMVLTKEDGQFKIKYIGQAIGVIPEDNNAQFETRLCDDGIEREFLTVDGLVWTKWDDPVDIFNRDVFKAQSMELHDDYEGQFGEDGLFHFTKFSFFGACALGTEILPAMRSATIEAQFSYDNMFGEIQNKMEQFKLVFSKTDEGGNENVDEKLELLKKYSLTEEDLKVKEINLEEYSIEELDVKLQEIASVENKDFALVASQLKDEIRAELYKDYTEDEWGYKSRSYWYVDHTDGLVIAEDAKDNYRLIGLSYTVNNDVIEIDFDSKKRVKLAYETIEGESDLQFNLTSKDKVEYELNVKGKELESNFTTEKETAVNEIKDELDVLSGNFNKLEEEVTGLRQFKQEKLSAERLKEEQSLFESFSTELTEDEMKEVKEIASEFTLEQIEEKLFTLVGKKKANFSKQTKKEKSSSIKIEFEHKDEEVVPYGGILNKYIKN